MPSAKPGKVNGLEVWLIGTDAELDLAVTALVVVGHVMQPVDDHGQPDPYQRHDLAGLDKPRRRQYLRLQLAVSAPAVDTTEVDLGLLADAA
ncbi:hypothetical protein ACQEVZ_20175 [Dactylosporangium sp. CA-152071]|uniref:hypothetical protein n=1 Tax=Dactylosporangium sp. CA-152071 TaxID=3239933 RepID=UPI003D94099B